MIFVPVLWICVTHCILHLASGGGVIRVLVGTCHVSNMVVSFVCHTQNSPIIQSLCLSPTPIPSLNSNVLAPQPFKIQPSPSIEAMSALTVANRKAVCGHTCHYSVWLHTTVKGFSSGEAVGKGSSSCPLL